MQDRVQVATEPGYDVHVGRGLLQTLGGLADRYSRVVVLTDDNVAPLHLERLPENLRSDVISLPAGEKTKSFAVLAEVLDRLCQLGLDRDSALLALGGGVIGDLSGLCASLFMRGIAFVQCPTTLLAQVDASVGGKTAVNLPSGKNLAGTFHQPAAVYADVDTLQTLPEGEFASGLGELLKTALLDGDSALAELEQRAPSILERKPETLAATVLRCVAFKAQVVSQDPHEGGRRKCLNLGHTFAHAIEHIAGFGAIPHGVAVAVGIGLAFEEAARCGVLEDAEFRDRAACLARRLALPFSLAELEERFDVRLGMPELLASMTGDKKSRGGKIQLVLPVRAGEVALDVPLVTS